MGYTVDRPWRSANDVIGKDKQCAKVACQIDSLDGGEGKCTYNVGDTTGTAVYYFRVLDRFARWRRGQVHVQRRRHHRHRRVLLPRARRRQLGQIHRRIAGRRGWVLPREREREREWKEEGRRL